MLGPKRRPKTGCANLPSSFFSLLLSELRKSAVANARPEACERSFARRGVGRRCITRRRASGPAQSTACAYFSKPERTKTVETTCVEVWHGAPYCESDRPGGVVGLTPTRCLHRAHGSASWETPPVSRARPSTARPRKAALTQSPSFWTRAPARQRATAAGTARCTSPRRRATAAASRSS